MEDIQYESVEEYNKIAFYVIAKEPQRLKQSRSWFKYGIASLRSQ